MLQAHQRMIVIAGALVFVLLDVVGAKVSIRTEIQAVDFAAAIDISMTRVIRPGIR